MSILEAYRALIAAGFQPERAVEFHWYSAEVRLSSVVQKLACENTYSLTGRGAPRVAGGCAFLREPRGERCGHEPGSRLSL